MDDIFPVNNSHVAYREQSTELEVLKEYAWDFSRDEFLFDENGDFVIVEGLEALKVKNYIELKVYRNRWLIHKGKVGSRLKELVGKSYEEFCLYAQQYVEEAIVDGKYVTSIEDISFHVDGSRAYMEFTVISVYGNYTTTTDGLEVSA